MDKNKFQKVIEEIKWKNAIEEVIGELGVQLKGSGNSLSGICPFHQTKTYDSFRVNRNGQYFKCFNPECNKKGNVITFVMLYKNCSFIEAVKFLAQRGECQVEFNNFSKDEMEQEDLISDIRLTTVEYCQNQLTDKARKYLGDRGITDNTGVDYSIGWDDAGLLNYLLQKYSLEDCINAGVIKNSNGKPADFFKNRIIFPNIVNGKVVHITGRSIDDTEPKYLHISGPIDYLYNESVLRKSKEVILVEGIMDCLTLIQHNIPACATYGATIFKDEWVYKFRNVDKVTICFDSEINNAGKEGAYKIAEKMPEKCWIMELPLDNEKKVDVNSFFTSGHTLEEFLTLREQAKPNIELLISSILPGLQGQELLNRLRPVVRILNKYDESLKEFYIDKVKKQFKISKEVIKTLIKEEKAREDDEKRKDKIDTDIELVLFSPAQDLINGKLYYTILLVTGDGTEIPFVVNSSKEFFPYSKEELIKRGLQFKEGWTLLTQGRWSTKLNIDNSIQRFIKGEANVDVVEVYKEIELLFQKYVWYPNKKYYKFLPLVVIGTYLFMIFDCFGYVFLNALKRSGKTRTLEIFSAIAFNAIFVNDITPASLSRGIENDRAILLIDEADKLSSELLTELSPILNAGYKKSGAVYKCVGDDHTPTKFSVYSPKVIASIKEVFHILADRGVTLYLLRRNTNVKLERFLLRKLEPVFQSLRNKLYVFALTYANEIRKIYEELEPIEGIEDRDEEIWSPIFAIAKFIDKQLQHNDPNIAKENLLYPQMVGLAIECKKEKEDRESEEQFENLVVRAIWDAVVFKSEGLSGRHQYLREENLYPAEYLYNIVVNEIGLQYWTKNKFGRFLYTPLHLIGKDKKDKPIKSIDGKNTLCYRITKIKLIEVAERLSIELPIYDSVVYIDEKDGDWL